MKTNDLVWEIFEDAPYDLDINTLVEYKAERILVEDEWGTEVQYHVVDVRVTLRHKGHQIGVRLDNHFKYELEETISSYLTRINER